LTIENKWGKYLEKRKISAIIIIIISLIIIVVVSAYFVHNSAVPIQGEHLAVSLQLQGYIPIPSDGSAVPLDLWVNVTNTGTQNVMITEVSILDSNMNPVYNESFNYQLDISSAASFYLVFPNYPPYCMARVFTSDGGIFDSNSLGS
jgi:hypothetical protein